MENNEFEAFDLKCRTGVCCQIWNVNNEWHLRNRMKEKSTNELLKISFECKDVARGSPRNPHQASDRPELTAASLIRALTKLMRFTPKKVLPPSGAAPHLWRQAKHTAQPGSCRTQFPLCVNFRQAQHTDYHHLAYYIHIKTRRPKHRNKFLIPKNVCGYA